MILAGQQFRAAEGVTTAIPPLDWETYSPAGYLWDPVRRKWGDVPGAPKNKRGLDVVGARNYVLDPGFNVLSLNYDLLDGRGKRLWVPSSDLRPIQLCEVSPYPLGSPPHGDPRHPWELLQYVEWTKGLLSAWYANFEWCVWNLYCVPKWNWPPLPIERMRCDMAKARVHALPGKLARAGEVLNLSVQKDKDGQRLLDKFTKPRNPTKKDPRLRILPEDDPVDAANLYRYNGTDIDAELAISLAIPDMPDEEIEIWTVDQHINQRGIAVDLAGQDNCIAIVEQAHEKYNAELYVLTGGAVEKASEVAELKRWLFNRCGVYTDSLDEEHADALLKTDLPPAARRALEIRQMLCSASVKKLFAMRIQQCGGRLYDLYVYASARTLRWAGVGPQPQNLPKGQFKTIEQVEEALTAIATRSLEYVEYKYGNALDAVGSCLRGLLVAGPGYDFICSDYTAIEGVVAAALAGEEWRLEVFRTHGLIYEASASKTTGIPLQEFIDYKKRTGDHHPMRAQIGKFQELSLGFGGWIGAMINFGADEFLSEAEMKTSILAWRRDSPWIVEMWGGQSRGRFDTAYEQRYGLEGAMIAAVEQPGQAFSYRSVTYQMLGDILYCRVPGDGLLKYHRPRLQKSTREWAQPWELELSYEGWNTNPKQGPIGWIRMMLYGGKAFENVVQKLARRVMAHGLVALDKAGYRPVLHSHDEPAGEVPQGDPRFTIQGFEACMNALPAFARGWPIRATGGWRGHRYRKA